MLNRTLDFYRLSFLVNRVGSSTVSQETKLEHGIPHTALLLRPNQPC
jgi:hypothetical protein